MAQFYSGQDGILKVGDDIAGKVRSWSFTANQAVLETTSLGDRSRSLEPGVRSITGNCSLYYYNDTNNVVGNILAKISSTSNDTVMSPLTLELNMTKAGTTRKLVLEVFFTSYAMNNSQGEIMAADISFEATGAPTTIDM